MSQVEGKSKVRVARTYLDSQYLRGTKLLVLEADHPAFRVAASFGTHSEGDFRGHR